MTNFNSLEEQVKNSIDEIGHQRFDNRMNRKTMSAVNYTLYLQPEVIDELSQEDLPEKFREDWIRMYSSFRSCVDEIKKDPNSRRGIVLNTTKFYEVFECFNLFQFVRNEHDRFTMIVTQRSADIAKLKQDCTFFVNIANKFSKKTNEVVDQIVIHFGNIHYEI